MKELSVAITFAINGLLIMAVTFFAIMVSRYFKFEGGETLTWAASTMIFDLITVFCSIYINRKKLYS